jgi:hypothetical protein
MVRASRFGWLIFIGAVLALPQALKAEHTAAPTEHDVTLLQARVAAGDRTAVQAAFRLRRRADGAVGEYIDNVLGSLVTTYPRLFLEELQRSGDFRRLDSLLANLGPKYVDKMKAQVSELRNREAALRRVNAPELRDVRDRCLKELSQMTKGRSLSNNTFERTVNLRGPHLAAASASRPAAQLGR